MRPRSTRFRSAVLLTAGAYGVHQLRYLVGYGAESHQQLSSQGHAYMAVLLPLLAGLIAVAGFDFVVRAAGARRTAGSDRLASLPTLWALASSLLAALYATQEWLEGQLATGHPAGFAGIFGHGGWLAIVFSAVVGVVVALTLRGASTAIELLAARRACRRSHWRPIGTLATIAFADQPPQDPVALFLAGRGPPAISP